jgi:hypothetical protein
VAAVSALLAYNTSLDRYNQAVSERNLMEWERLNEKVVISMAERLDDGSLNATIQNIGAVTAHLVSLWLSAYDGYKEPRWQQQYNIDIWMSPGETKCKFGQNDYAYTIIKPGSMGEALSSVYLSDTSWIYVIKIVTERGNIATYILQPPKEEEEIKGPPLAYSSGTMKIKYAFLTEWKSPYISDVELQAVCKTHRNLKFKATFKNIADHPVTITTGNILIQVADARPHEKVLFMGGYLTNGQGTYLPGEVFEVEWLITNWSSDFENIQNLKDILDAYPNRKCAFVGIAVFSSSEGEPFFSVGLLMDGLLVYRT